MVWLEAAAAVPCCLGAACFGAVGVLRVFHGSVGMCPPTAAQLAEEREDACALFRHLPALRSRVAWRELGVFPTPIQDLSVACANGRRVRVAVKREDYASLSYGGNKVRTLQHQLAVCEARAAAGGPPTRLLVLGSGGSNQVVATVVHARAIASLPSVDVAYLSPDAPCLDNTLNMLSTFSFKTGWVGTWDSWRTAATAVARALAGTAIVVPLGGNSVSGVLGQVGGALELAEQIARGEADDPDGIYVPVGSSCTVSGLIVGVALARYLELDAFKSPQFAIHGILVHPLFAAAHRLVGLHTAPFGRFVPLTVQHTVRTTCAELVRLGGPDVLPLCVALMASQLRLETAPEIVGTYGAHSQLSREAAAAYEQSGELSLREQAATGQQTAHSDEARRGGAPDARAAPKPLWLCGHFAAKSFAAVLRDADEDPSRKLLLWHTKSATQPRGPLDEWRRMLETCEASPTVRRWADEGAAASSLRRGSVDTRRGDAQQYRKLMTKLD